jgi:hypothetical protein
MNIVSSYEAGTFGRLDTYDVVQARHIQREGFVAHSEPKGTTE